MKEVTMFVTDDGMKFDNRVRAQAHERELQLQKDIRAFVEEVNPNVAGGTPARYDCIANFLFGYLFDGHRENLIKLLTLVHKSDPRRLYHGLGNVVDDYEALGVAIDGVLDANARPDEPALDESTTDKLTLDEAQLWSLMCSQPSTFDWEWDEILNLGHLNEARSSVAMDGLLGHEMVRRVRRGVYAVKTPEAPKGKKTKKGK